MSGRGLATLAMVALLAACGDPGAPQYGGGPPPIDQAYGQCAFCHDSVAVPMYLTGGHGSVTVSCEQCHSQDLTPGRVGPDHRSVPVCADCHTKQMTHMDPAAGTPQQCLVCHTPHGSPNLYLVNDEITVPDGNVVPIDFTNLQGKADGSFASATQSRHGPVRGVPLDDLLLQQRGRRRPALHQQLRRLPQARRGVRAARIAARARSPTQAERATPRPPPEPRSPGEPIPGAGERLARSRYLPRCTPGPPKRSSRLPAHMVTTAATTNPAAVNNAQTTWDSMATPSFRNHAERGFRILHGRNQTRPASISSAYWSHQGGECNENRRARGINAGGGAMPVS